MDMDPEDLQNLVALLGVLRINGVTSFEGFDVKLTIDPIFLGESGGGPPRPQAAPAEVLRQVRDSAKSVWDDPSLWPQQGGKKLNFDGTLTE